MSALRTGSPTGHRVSLEALIRLRHDAQLLTHTDLTRAQSAPAGNRRARLRGRGVDFEEVRTYQPGDDARSIDWRVTARKGKPHTKVYREERERPALVLLDQRGNMAFGSRVRFKSVAGAEVAALIAWAATEHGDRVGGMLLTDNGLHEQPPRRSHVGVLRLLKKIAEHSPSAPPRHPAEPDLTLLLKHAIVHAVPGTFSALVSDFHDLNDTHNALLAQLARRCELLCVMIYDVLEAELPPPGVYAVSNGDGRSSIVSDAGAQVRHKQQFSARLERLRQCQTQCGFNLLTLRADEAPLVPLKRSLAWTRP